MAKIPTDENRNLIDHCNGDVFRVGSHRWRKYTLLQVRLGQSRHLIAPGHETERLYLGEHEVSLVCIGRRPNLSQDEWRSARVETL